MHKENVDVDNYVDNLLKECGFDVQSRWMRRLGARMQMRPMDNGSESGYPAITAKL